MENQEQNTATVPDNQEQNTVQGISDETKEKLKALPLPITGGKKQGGKKSVYLDQMTLLQQMDPRRLKSKPKINGLKKEKNFHVIWLVESKVLPWPLVRIMF